MWLILILSGQVELEFTQNTLHSRQLPELILQKTDEVCDFPFGLSSSAINQLETSNQFWSAYSPYLISLSVFSVSAFLLPAGQILQEQRLIQRQELPLQQK